MGARNASEQAASHRTRRIDPEAVWWPARYAVDLAEQGCARGVLLPLGRGPLSDLDRVMLALDCVARWAQHHVFPGAGRVVDERDFGRCILLAADATARALRKPEVVRPRWVRAYCRGYASWRRQAIELLCSVRNTAQESERDLVFLRVWLSLAEGVGVPHDWRQHEQAAARAMEVLGLLDCHEDGPQGLSVYGFATRNRRGGTGTYVGRDGQLKLSQRDARDVLARAFGARRRDRHAIRDAQKHTWEGAVPEVEDPGAGEAIEVADALAAVRLVVSRRREQAQRGTLRALALEYFEGLAAGEVAVRHLARQAKVSRSALARAFEGELEAVRCGLQRFSGK